MKKFFALGITISVIFISCFETEEKIMINADKSGIYNIIMSMNGLMAQMKAITGNEMTSQTITSKDTVILFKSFTDTSTVLTAAEKEMLHDGSVTVHIDDTADEMKFTITVPFKNIEQLPELKKNLAAALDKAKVGKELLDKPGTEEFPGMEQKNADGFIAANPVDSAFLWSVQGTTITNKLKDSAYVANILSGNTNLQTFKQVAPMFGEITYKTTYILPSPIKSYKGTNTWISTDKKTVSFTTSLTELFEKPAAMEYELTY